MPNKVVFGSSQKKAGDSDDCWRPKKGKGRCPVATGA